jgi:molybdate transport system ATP-binding protein
VASNRQFGMTEPPTELTVAQEEADSERSGGLGVHAVIDRDGFRVDVAFTAHPGEILGILGPNGAGKTTLLRAVAGLTPLTAGQILLDGEPLDDPAQQIFVAAEHRPVGLVFQNYRLFPHLSVRDNIAFAARASHAGRRRARQAAQPWLDRLALAEFADRKPAQLSGGQAQRVALARALAAEPSVLLLDEPLAALDARTKIEVRAELQHHLADFAGPTLLVTHDPLEAILIADRLVVVEDGRVTQNGPPATVARRPATEYIARLVGINVYPGERDTRGRVRLDGGGTLIAAGFQPGAEQDPVPTGQVLLGLRPTAIALHTSQPKSLSSRNVWPGVVARIELLTDRVRVQVEATPPALIDITPDAAAELRLAAGMPIWLSAKATDIDVYLRPSTAGDAQPET